MVGKIILCVIAYLIAGFITSVILNLYTDDDECNIIAFILWPLCIIIIAIEIVDEAISSVSDFIREIR